MTTVRIAGDVHGNVIAPSFNNPEYGYIRVEQEALQINHEGWVKAAKRSAFIKGKVEDLKKFNYVPGQEIVGKIVVRESLKPFNSENPDKNLKIAGETGVICRVDDQPIYRECFFTTNVNAYDEFLTHTNSEEIREVQAAQKAVFSKIINKPSEASL